MRIFTKDTNIWVYIARNIHKFARLFIKKCIFYTNRFSVLHCFFLLFEVLLSHFLRQKPAKNLTKIVFALYFDCHFCDVFSIKTFYTILVMSKNFFEIFSNFCFFDQKFYVFHIKFSAFNPALSKTFAKNRPP